MKLITALLALSLTFSVFAKAVYVKCEVMSNDDGVVTLNCDEKNLDNVKEGDKVKVKVQVADSGDIEGC